jgi:hypothetical protein
MHLRLWPLALLVSSGCADHIADAVRARAAHDYKCGPDDIDVTLVAGTAYRAKGCGENEIYDCVMAAINRGAGDYLCRPESQSNGEDP